MSTRMMKRYPKWQVEFFLNMKLYLYFSIILIHLILYFRPVENVIFLHSWFYRVIDIIHGLDTGNHKLMERLG